jgi:phage baseplate assembly protein W
MISRSDFFDQPFHVDGRGRTATTGVDDHVRDLIMAVLFTNPGERVNLPEFGCGLRQLVFAPNGDMLASATQAIAASALDRWLSDWIIVDRVEVSAEDSELRVVVDYTRRDTREPGRVQVAR